MTLRVRTLFVVILSLLLARPVPAQEATAKISWSKDLTTAFEEAKAQQKILMICVNAKYVDGKKTEEPAAKGLREVVYKDARVVARSREFVCAFLTPASSSTEYGELRTVGIEGRMISPQHIFIHPDGQKVLLRKQYWSNGSGEKGVLTLLSMMEEARQELAGGGGEPDADAEENKAPAGAERPAWIKERIREVEEGNRKERNRAINVLLRSDKGGDCTTPLILLLAEHKKDKDPTLLADLIRGLGRDKLTDAAQPIAGFLSHKKEEVRGTAAVSLEYIGDRDKAVVAALLKAAGREKDLSIANHMYRALGRCGVESSKARSLLLKKCAGSKSEFASYGPTLGLSYFEKDAKAARGVEKILKKIGVPGGRRGGGTNTVKRGVVCWTLAWIGDPKSSAFMEEELLAKLKNVKAFWVEGLKGFYRLTARACDGNAEMSAVAGGVRGFVAFAKGADLGRYGAETRNLMDEYRKHREAAGFVPRGDYLLGDGGDG